VPTSLLDELAHGFAAGADPARARGARAYMRNQFAFYGIPARQLQHIARAVTQGRPPPRERELVKVARACWRKPEREWQYFACWYLRRHVRACSAALAADVEPLITTRSWWDTVDTLASHTVGPLAARYPEVVRTLDRWIGADDIWLARTAILHQLGYKADTDPDRLFRYCLRRASDKEFFVRKAIGWALREYSKTDEAAVRAFVQAHDRVLSALSKTEALKWLERRASRSAV
jgi:3-methyladenine DNA glycosylase AlkD